MRVQRLGLHYRFARSFSRPHSDGLQRRPCSEQYSVQPRNLQYAGRSGSRLETPAGIYIEIARRPPSVVLLTKEGPQDPTRPLPRHSPLTNLLTPPPCRAKATCHAEV